MTGPDTDLERDLRRAYARLADRAPEVDPLARVRETRSGPSRGRRPRARGWAAVAAVAAGVVGISTLAVVLGRPSPEPAAEVPVQRVALAGLSVAVPTDWLVEPATPDGDCAATARAAGARGVVELAGSWGGPGPRCDAAGLAVAGLVHVTLSGRAAGDPTDPWASERSGPGPQTWADGSGSREVDLVGGAVGRRSSTTCDVSGATEERTCTGAVVSAVDAVAVTVDAPDRRQVDRVLDSVGVALDALAVVPASATDGRGDEPRAEGQAVAPSGSALQVRRLTEAGFPVVLRPVLGHRDGDLSLPPGTVARQGTPVTMWLNSRDRTWAYGGRTGVPHAVAGAYAMVVRQGPADDDGARVQDTVGTLTVTGDRWRLEASCGTVTGRLRAAGLLFLAVPDAHDTTCGSDGPGDPLRLLLDARRLQVEQGPGRREATLSTVDDEELVHLDPTP